MKKQLVLAAVALAGLTLGGVASAQDSQAGPDNSGEAPLTRSQVQAQTQAARQSGELQRMEHDRTWDPAQSSATTPVHSVSNNPTMVPTSVQPHNQFDNERGAWGS